MFCKRELIRVARIDRDNFCLDLTKKIQGRGAYICDSKNCLERAKRRKAFEHAFKSKRAFEVYKILDKKLTEE